MNDQAGILPLTNTPNSSAGILHSGAAYGGTLNECQRPKCECHECTQARWKMSLGALGQLK